MFTQEWEKHQLKEIKHTALHNTQSVLVHLHTLILFTRVYLHIFIT